MPFSFINENENEDDDTNTLTVNSFINYRDYNNSITDEPSTELQLG